MNERHQFNLWWRDSESRVASVVQALCPMWDDPWEMRQRKAETWARLLRSIGRELEP